MIKALFLYFNLCSSVMLYILSCSLTFISILTNISNPSDLDKQYICNIISCGLFCFQWVDVRGYCFVDIGGIVDHHCFNFLFIRQVCTCVHSFLSVVCVVPHESFRSIDQSVLVSFIIWPIGKFEHCYGNY
jgi:hypothetical protein